MMSARASRSFALRFIRRDSLATNGCLAGDTSCPIWAATFMVMPSVEPYIFLLIQINMRDETPSGMDHLKMWRVDAAIAAYRGNESTIDESGIDRTTFRL